MRTYLECIPCFLKQALEAARKTGADEALCKKILDEVVLSVPGFGLESSPPEMARVIHGIVKRHTGVEDPYKDAKRQSNDLALAIFDKLENKVRNSGDELLAAVELAIAGNIIDYGVKNSLDVDAEIEKILNLEHQAFEREKAGFFDHVSFRKVLGEAGTVLYLADNAGETVFDRILIEAIKRQDPGKLITYAVKDKPIINDALAEDAVVCGIDRSARVVSSGSDAPGTILPLCSEEFRDIFKQADMVISKGQGNFETLSPADRPVFFLFMAKCPVVAAHAGCEVGDILLLYEKERDPNYGSAMRT